jgi:hypothetical protein
LVSRKDTRRANAGYLAVSASTSRSE